jgi:tetratricopeptide (TPR) repeat protein
VQQYAAGGSESAARHLLHNLRNAKALRSNPLVSHLFASDALHPGTEPVADRIVISRVSQAVAAVLRSLAVARDLGISLRTLFRDLDGVRLRLVEELPRYSPSAGAGASIADTFELQLRHAHLLRNTGRFSEALAVLDRLAAEAGTPLRRARAWNASAVVLVDWGAVDEASTTIEKARDALAGYAELETSPLLVACDIEITRAAIARVNGNTAAAIGHYDRAVEISRPLIGRAPIDATDVYVRALSQSAVTNWMIGRVHLSSHAVERAWDALERLTDPPEGAHYSLLAASSLVHLVADGDVAWAIREMSAAATLAERHGMLHDALMALGWLSGLERRNGNLAGAVETGRRTIAIAHGTMSGADFALLCAAAAENEAEAGNIGGAIALIAQGRARIAPGRAAWARLLLGEAAVMLAAGDHNAAISVAQAAAEAMQRQGKDGFVGAACLIQASAYERLGDSASALLATREALPLLETFGKSPELVAAYELSARLTGNRKHRITATELRKLLPG